MKISLWCCENQAVILVKSECDFGKVGVWFWVDKVLLNIRLYHKSFYIHYLIQYLLFFYLPGVILHKLKGWWQDGMRRDCLRFMTRLNETGLHPFFDKMVWDRTASIFITRLYETGTHPFLWQNGMRQGCIHFLTKWHEAGLHLFFDKTVWDRTAFIFRTSWHKTGTHPFLWQASIRPVLIHFYDKLA